MMKPPVGETELSVPAFSKKRRNAVSVFLFGAALLLAIGISSASQEAQRADAAGPGGVSPGTNVLWLKGNVGTNCSTQGCSVTSWSDQSGNSKNGTGVGNPTLNVAGLNFNPSISFNGTSQRFNLPSGFDDWNGASVYVVGTTQEPAVENGFVSFAASGGRHRFTISQGGASPITTPLMRLTDDLPDANGDGGEAGQWPHGSPTIFTAQVTDDPGIDYVAADEIPYFARNGLSLDNIETSWSPGSGVTRTANYIGATTDYVGSSFYYLEGQISEVVVYNSSLSTANRRKVESYLALKYGITMNQTNPQNYTTSGSVNAWSATGNSAWDEDIAGIGRDDSAGQNQKQSKSVNTDDILTVGLGTVAATNAANSNTFPTDVNFLTWGNNGGATGSFTSTEVPSGLTRIAREYKFQENNGDVGTVKVSVPDNSSSATTKLPAEDGKVFALVDADGDFSSGAVRTALTLNGTEWEGTLNVDPTTMPYMTFATGNVLEAQFEFATYTSVNETTNVTIRVAVEGGDLTGRGDQTVDVDIVGGTATSGGTDFTLSTPFTITIPEDDYTTVQYFDFVVTLNGDFIHEGGETIEFALSDPSSEIELGTNDETSVTITDDDVVGLEVIQSGSSTDTTEDGATDTFTVRLTSQPQSGTIVTIGVGGDSDTSLGGDFGQGVLLQFNPANWSTVQTITVEGFDDLIVNVDDPRDSTIEFTILTTGGLATTDTDYAVLTGIADVINRITDNDIDTDDDGIVDTVDPDDDGDGVDDEVEDLAPNGDGNGDGVADSLQSDVTTVDNPVTDSYTTVEADGDCDFIDGYFVVAESALDVQDATYEYPVGLNDFTLECDNPGDSATVTFFYDKIYDTSAWDVRKFDTEAYADLADAAIGTDSVNGTNVTTITYSLTDGQSLDEDADENGIIEDPSGPGVIPVDEVIPAPGTNSAGGSLVNTGVSALLIVQYALGLILGGLVLSRSKRLQKVS